MATAEITITGGKLEDTTYKDPKQTIGRPRIHVTTQEKKEAHKRYQYNYWSNKLGVPLKEMVVKVEDVEQDLNVQARRIDKLFDRIQELEEILVKNKLLSK